MNLDLTKTSTDDREFIKVKGVHTLKVVNVSEDSSKNGKELLIFDFINRDNLHFEHRFTIQQSTLPIIKRFMDTLGMDTSKKINTNECVGSYIRGYLEFKEYNGKTYLNCTKWKKSEANKKSEPTNKSVETIPEIEINEDDIPF